MPEEKTLVLEIIRQFDLFKMSVFEPQETASTLKQYTQHKVNINEIENLSQEITAILNKANFKDPMLLKGLQKSGQALWEHVLSRATKEQLRASQTLNLTLIIDEELIDIPWEFLYDGVNFLCLKYNMGRLVRTKSRNIPIQYRVFAHAFKMLILANPTNDLKCAYQEGLSIKNQFERRRSNIHIDFKSTSISRLYVKKNLCDYDIIHFAGHSRFDPLDSKNNGWVLEDGNLNIRDILSMGDAGSLPALIFSNACFSAGSGSPGAVDIDYQKKNYSIAGAFLFSGVRHYIGSIRRIEDSAGLSFAKEFYHNLVLGKSVGESMRLSRIKLVREYGIMALHWTNYLLYGDPCFVLFKSKAKAIKQKHKIKYLKKWLIRFLIALSILGIFIYMGMVLPTLNPNAYRLYLKSRWLFSKGNNQEVVLVANQVISKDPNLLDIYRIVANSFLRLGDKTNALKYYFDYAYLAEKKHDYKRLSSGYIEIGWFYQQQGDYPKSLDFYNKALDLARKNKDRLNEAIALRKSAVWHIDKEEYDLALQLLTKSAEINRERQYSYDHRYNLACDYFDIGLLFSNKDDFETAKYFYLKSLSIFEKLKVEQELSDCYFNLGEVYLFEKQYRQALGHYLAGLKIDESQGNNLSLVSDYNMLGELYMEMERLSEAEESFQKAINLAKQIQLQPELAAAYRNLGLFYKKTGKKKKAKEYLRLAQEIYSAIDLPTYQEIKKEILSVEY